MEIMTRVGRVPGTRRGGTAVLGSDLGTSLDLTPALSSTLLSESILEAYGLNFHMVGGISSLHRLEKDVWMIIHSHSSIIVPVWSRLVPWGCIYSLV